MKAFNHIAKVVREGRENHPRRMSQTDVSRELGYLNGQFVSNMERGKCSVPLKKVAEMCLLLNIPTEVVKAAMLKDLEDSFDFTVQKDLTNILAREACRDTTTNA